LWWSKLFGQSAARADAKLLALQARIADLETQLMTDALTGIPSRQSFAAQFERTARPGDHILFVDLDDFKSVNDFYGHVVGDRLLCGIARAMAADMVGRGQVARLAGDEFLVHVSACGGNIDGLIQSLTEAIQSVQIEVGELQVSRTGSVGATVVSAGMSLTEAVVAADRALLAAKRRGRNRSAMVLDRDAPLAVRKPSVEEVRLALQRQEIGYYVQPIVNLRTMQPEGYEALLRWNRPNGEVVGPAHFLETMQSSYNDDTTPPLVAAHQTAEWAALKQGRFISFNLSTVFLEQIAFQGPAWVQSIVGDIPLDKIVFELVETIVDREEDRISEVVADLRASGIRVALDDFGTGRSTLERLQRIPVDIVKIDKHFLHMAERSPRDLEILKHMVDLTRSTAAVCVAEGIETQAHLELVRDLGVELGQGFFLGRPAPTSVFDRPDA
jgi:diguanylate cyclase (GGDEF)-like protein